MSVRLALGSCIEVMRALPDNSVDSIVTDPPYGLTAARPSGRSEATRGAVMGGFMGMKWDSGVPSVEVWIEALRVLKPGGQLLAFGGTRTYHRMVCAVEDAGFEIRDQLAWVFGSGFPKSLDVSKAIDNAAGATRETGPVDPARAGRLVNQRGDYETEAGWSAGNRSITIDPPATEAARQWQGWGTALKPGYEPIVLARKPLIGTVAANVLAHGTGALNIDECRVPGTPAATRFDPAKHSHVGWRMNATGAECASSASELGRWPANLIHDGSDEVVTAFPSSGSAARFFYCAKASKADRNAGLGTPSSHPTVKPTDLMRWLVRLITPPGGTVLDPFMGSGSTGRAAVLEGFDFVGCDIESEYLAIAEQRIGAAQLEYLDNLLGHTA